MNDAAGGDDEGSVNSRSALRPRQRTPEPIVLLPSRVSAIVFNMNALSLLELVAVIVFAVARLGLVPALAVGGVTAAGAAFVAGRVVVPTFYGVAAIVTLVLMLSFVTRRGAVVARPRLPPGYLLLLLFAGYAIAVTLLAPILLLGAADVPGETGVRPGSLTVSNVAQCVYLILSLCVVLYVARDSRTGPSVLGVAAVGATALSAWRYVSVNTGLLFPEGFFDNSPSPIFIETAAGNIPRFRGIFTEPAGLAQSCLITVVWCVATLPKASWAGRTWRVAVAGTAIYLGIVSTSTTFVLAAPIIASVALSAALIHLLKRGSRVPLLTTAGGIALVVALVSTVIPLVTFLQATFDAKVGTSSYGDRNSANSNLYDLLVNTWGLGGGLGTERGSSFVATLAGTTGVLGVLTFGAAVAFYLTEGSRFPEYRPVVWVLITILIVKAVSGPDLNDTSGVLWLSLGLLAQAAYRRRDTSGAGGDPKSLPALAVPLRSRQ